MSIIFKRLEFFNGEIHHFSVTSPFRTKNHQKSWTHYIPSNRSLYKQNRTSCHRSCCPLLQLQVGCACAQYPGIFPWSQHLCVAGSTNYSLNWRWIKGQTMSMFSVVAPAVLPKLSAIKTIWRISSQKSVNEVHSTDLWRREPLKVPVSFSKKRAICDFLANPTWAWFSKTRPKCCLKTAAFQAVEVRNGMQVSNTSHYQMYPL